MASDVEAQRITSLWWIETLKSIWIRLVPDAPWHDAGAVDEARTRLNGIPSGYPRFCGLIGSHPAFSLCRRFSDVRARLLLVKQMRVSELEKELEKLDFEEQQPIFRGSIRRDANPRRNEVLTELDEALKVYDELAERNVRMLQLPPASSRNTASLQNWVEDTGAICRKETSFLQKTDLCAAGGAGHYGLELMESMIERSIIKFRQWLGQSSPSSHSANKRVFIFQGPVLRTVTHVAITALVVLLVLAPIIAMQSVESTTFQVSCITIASMIFTVIVSGPMNARPAEVFVAGTTYAALLVVFFPTKRSLS